MPQNIRYTASRSLVAGHTAGQVYYYDLPLTDKDMDRRVRSDEQESLNGTIYTTYHHGRNHWRCETRPLTLAEANVMREILHSVEDGQQFQFDPTWNTGHSPSDYRSVVLVKGSARERRHKMGSTQSDHRFAFSFELREVS